jgi:hypothetical protein
MYPKRLVRRILDLGLQLIEPRPSEIFAWGRKEETRKGKKKMERNGKGIHAPSIYGTAVVDYALTIGLAIAVTAWTKIPLVLTTIACMVLSLIAHAMLGIDTRAIRWIRGAA